MSERAISGFETSIELPPIDESGIASSSSRLWIPCNACGEDAFQLFERILIGGIHSHARIPDGRSHEQQSAFRWGPSDLR
jgi:hypothetical protein